MRLKPKDVKTRIWASGLTCRELAERFDVRKQNLSKVVQGVPDPPQRELREKLADFLGVPVEELPLRRDDQPAAA